LLAALFVSSSAWADDPEVEQCFFAYEETQVQLKREHFSRAIALAQQCSDGCPEEISQQCQAWSRQAERDAPSVLFLARFEDGKDAPEISVEVDGESSKMHEELLLDPGKHTIIFRRDDGWEDTLDVTIYRGEKRRPIKTVVPARAKDTMSPVKKTNHKARNWAIVSFSVGAVGLAVAGTGTMMALQRRTKLDDCAPSCSEERLQDAREPLLPADIGLAVGVLGVATGVAILLWGNPRETKGAQARLTLTPTQGGAAGILSGHF
jgi:hypothetical protein